MEESHLNRFVIRIESGHPGYTDYKIISTPDGFKEMLQTIQPKIDGIENRRKEDPQFEFSRHLLFSEYATLDPGKTSRIYVSFDVDSDLEKYHRPPNRFTKLFGGIFNWMIIILAAIGVGSILRLLFW